MFITPKIYDFQKFDHRKMRYKPSAYVSYKQNIYLDTKEKSPISAMHPSMLSGDYSQGSHKGFSRNKNEQFIHLKNNPSFDAPNFLQSPFAPNMKRMVNMLNTNSQPVFKEFKSSKKNLVSNILGQQRSI